MAAPAARQLGCPAYAARDEEDTSGSENPAEAAGAPERLSGKRKTRKLKGVWGKGEPEAMALPTEDLDELEVDDFRLWGAGLDNLVREVSLDSNSGKTRRGLAATAACFVLSVLGLGIVVTLMARYAAENHRGGSASGTTLVVFAFGSQWSNGASPTDAALAYLSAALLGASGANLVEGAGNASALVPPAQGRSGKATLPDGTLVKSWRPPVDGHEARILALVHGGGVASALGTYGFAAPRVRDLAAGGVTEPEVDAFQLVRALLGGEASGSELVIVSHPHHLPYLVVLARASGFRPVVLDPALYDQVPWARFGCDAAGYPSSSMANATSAAARAREGVQRELGRLSAYEVLREQDPAQFIELGPVLDVANATLYYYKCAVGGTGGC